MRAQRGLVRRPLPMPRIMETQRGGRNGGDKSSTPRSNLHNVPRTQNGEKNEESQSQEATVRRARPAIVSRTQNFGETAAVSLPRESSSSCRFQFDASVVAAKGDTHTHAPKVKHIHARACGDNASRFRSEFSAQRASRAARTLLGGHGCSVSHLAPAPVGRRVCARCLRDGGEGVLDIAVNSGRARLRWSGVTVAVR